MNGHRESKEALLGTTVEALSNIEKAAASLRRLVLQLRQIAENHAPGGESSEGKSLPEPETQPVNSDCIPLPFSQMAWKLLSPREREIAVLVARGLPNKSIAYKLRISPATVSTHMSRIFRKLGIDSRAALAGQAAAVSGGEAVVREPGVGPTLS